MKDKYGVDLYDMFDGWIGSPENLQNPHNLGKDGYRVTFERWVR